MGQRVIPCDVLNEYITGAGVVVGAAGSHDEVLLELDFRAADSVWAGTTRVVTFRDALSQNPVDVILGVDLLSEGHTDVYLVPIPARAKAIEGEMRMTIRGVIVQGDKELVRVVTKTALFRVLPSELNLYDENTDVPASAAEQLQSQIDGVKGKFVALDEAVDATRQSAEAAGASAKSAANSEQRAGELTQGFDERVTSALEDVETARTGAMSDVEAARSGALTNVWNAESVALAEIQTSKTDALGSVEEARQTALTNLNSKVQEASGYVSEAERQAMAAAKSATDSAGHAADAKRYAEQAGDVVGGDFATNADLEAVEDKVDQHSSDITALGNSLTTLSGNVDRVAQSVSDLETQVEQDVGQAIGELEKKVVPADWSQNDTSAPDYVKNRTHWSSPLVEDIVLPEEDVPGTGGYDLLVEHDAFQGYGDEELVIVVDGVAYQEPCWVNENGDYCWGDSRILGLDVHPSDTPCVLVSWFEDFTMMYNLTCSFRDTSKSHAIEVKMETGVEYHGLDKKYLPAGVAYTTYWNVNVPVSWTASTGGGYQQVINVEGMQAQDRPIFDVVLGSDVDANALYLEAFDLVTRLSAVSGRIYLYANGAAPTTAFKIQMQVVRAT